MKNLPWGEYGYFLELHIWNNGIRHNLCTKLMSGVPLDLPSLRGRHYFVSMLNFP